MQHFSNEWGFSQKSRILDSHFKPNDHKSA